MATPSREITEKIKEVHKDYTKKLNELRRQQRGVVDDFIRDLEKLKIEEIKKSLRE